MSKILKHSGMTFRYRKEGQNKLTEMDNPKKSEIVKVFDNIEDFTVWFDQDTPLNDETIEFIENIMKNSIWKDFVLFRKTAEDSKRVKMPKNKEGKIQLRRLNFFLPRELSDHDIFVNDDYDHLAKMKNIKMNYSIGRDGKRTLNNPTIEEIEKLENKIFNMTIFFEEPLTKEQVKEWKDYIRDSRFSAFILKNDSIKKATNKRSKSHYLHFFRGQEPTNMDTLAMGSIEYQELKGFMK